MQHLVWIYNRLHNVFLTFHQLTWRAAPAVAAGATDAVVQPGGVGEGVSLVRCPRWWQTLLGVVDSRHVEPCMRAIDTRTHMLFYILMVSFHAIWSTVFPTHHACVIVLYCFGFVLLDHTCKAAGIGGGTGKVVALRDGRGPATEKRAISCVTTLQRFQF